MIYYTRVRIFFVMLLALAVLLSACHAQATQPGKVPDLTSSQWLLESLLGNDLVRDSRITFHITAEGFEGTTGCNNYGGKFAARKGGILKISEMAVTVQLCQQPAGIMQQERTYVDALNRIAAYRLSGDRLELQDAAGETILVYTRQEEFDMEPSALMGTIWQLISLDGQPVPQGPTATPGESSGVTPGESSGVTPGESSGVTLAFLNRQLLSGTAGCRDYVAAYTAQGDDLKLYLITMLGPDCPNGDQRLEQEGQYIDRLESMERYRLAQDRLEIIDVRGRSLIYAPLPPESSATLEGRPGR